MCGFDVLYKCKKIERPTPVIIPISTPTDNVMIIVEIIAKKSVFEYRQVLFIAPKSTKLSTAIIIVAARVAFGKKKRSGVRKAVAIAIPIAVKVPAAGVLAPASKLTTDLANPPVTGKPPETADPKFEAPNAINSSSGFIRCLFFAATV